MAEEYGKAVGAAGRDGVGEASQTPTAHVAHGSVQSCSRRQGGKCIRCERVHEVQETANADEDNKRVLDWLQKNGFQEDGESSAFYSKIRSDQTGMPATFESGVAKAAQ